MYIFLKALGSAAVGRKVVGFDSRPGVTLSSEVGIENEWMNGLFGLAFEKHQEHFLVLFGFLVWSII